MLNQKAFLPSIKTLFCALVMVSLYRVPEARAADITIASAASLQNALEAMKSDIEQNIPGVKLRVSPGASGALQQQIINGAPIDIFLSAADKPMNELEKLSQLAPGTRKVFLSNTMVLIGPKKSDLKAFEDLKKPIVKRIALGEPRTVPAGEYAMQILKTLKLDRSLTAKFVFAKDVRQVLSYVQRGEVDAGFVYRSDVQDGTDIEWIQTAPEDSHEQIRYAMALIKSSKQTDKATQVLAYLEGPKAAVIWQRFGFALPTETPLAKAKNSAPH